MLTIRINDGVNSIGINPDSFKISWCLDPQKISGHQTGYEILILGGKRGGTVL